MSKLSLPRRSFLSGGASLIASGAFAQAYRPGRPPGLRPGLQFLSTIPAAPSLPPSNPNMLQAPIDFDNTTYWSIDNGAVSANVTTAPDGTLTADKPHASTTGTSSPQIYQYMSAGFVNGKSYVVSVFGKAAECPGMIIEADFSGGGVGGCYDFSAGTFVGSETGTSFSVSGGIYNYSNGWFRAWFNFTATTTSDAHIFFILQKVANAYKGATQSYVAGDGLYLWGAKVEQASTLSTY